LARRRKVQALRAESVPVDSRRIVVVGPDSALWKGEPGEMEVVDAIVFLEPPAGTPPHDVESARDRLANDMGAAVVRTLPAAKGQAEVPEQAARPEEADESIRQVVFAMAAECRTADPDLLRTALEECLGAAGV